MSDESTYLTELAQLWAGGREEGCPVGHSPHASRTVDIRLDGPTPLVPDTPGISLDHARDLRLDVYDWRRYAGIPGCPAADVVSESIETQHMWEGFQTLLALTILDDDAPGAVVDIGAHLGWYTVLAAQAGRPVLAVDAGSENLALVEANAAHNGVGEMVTTCRAWIGCDTPDAPLPPPSTRLRFVKADIEGAEDHAVRALLPLLQASLIDFLLVEISPVFADHYPATCGRIIDAGYTAHLVPAKGTPLPPFEADPLGMMEPLGALDFDQRDVVFRRLGA